MKDRRALAGLFSGALLIGVAPILVRLSDLSAPAIAGWRMLLSALVLAPLAGVRPWRRPDLLWAAVPGVFFAADLTVWHLSITRTTPANATLEANLASLWVSLIGWRFLGERVRPWFGVGFVVALGGAAVLLGVSLGVSRERLMGDGLGILTSFFYAGYLLSAKGLRARWSALDLMVVSTVAAGVCLLPVTALSPGAWIPADAHGWWVVIGLALLVHVAGQGLIVYALARLPAGFSAVTLLLQPVVAAVLGWIWLGIALGPVEMFGGALVLLGIALCRIGSGGRAEVSAPA